MNYSTSEENYIKAIFHLQGTGKQVTTNELAAQLQTRPASITDMLKKLKTKKLVHYEAYKGFRLSAEGRKVALGIIRRHRLWEYFLAEKLRFDWDEVHEVAEDLEHVSSMKLIDKLEEYLGFPRFDPHGDPIPDINGRMEQKKLVSLFDLPLQTKGEVSQVSNQSPDMLEIMRHKKIGIGTRLEVKKHFEFDHSVEVRLGTQSTTMVSEQLARNILVKVIK